MYTSLFLPPPFAVQAATLLSSGFRVVHWNTPHTATHCILQHTLVDCHVLPTHTATRTATHTATNTATHTSWFPPVAKRLTVVCGASQFVSTGLCCCRAQCIVVHNVLLCTMCCWCCAMCCCCCAQCVVVIVLLLLRITCVCCCVIVAHTCVCLCGIFNHLLDHRCDGARWFDLWSVLRIATTDCRFVSTNIYIHIYVNIYTHIFKFVFRNAFCEKTVI